MLYEKEARPLVSVIIASYNSMSDNKCIDKVLSSIFNQTYRNIEVIIVDNYSNDKTKVICQQYPVDFFSFVSDRSAAYNFGLNMAKGDYVLFLASDQVLSPTVIEECVSIASSKNADCVVLPMISLDYKKSKTRINCVTLHALEFATFELTTNPHFYSKAIIGDQRFERNLSLGEDHLFWLNISKKKPRVFLAKSPFFHYEDPSINSLVRRSWKYGLMYESTRKSGLGARFLTQLSAFRPRSVKRILRVVRDQPKVFVPFILYLYIKYASFTFGYFSSKFILMATLFRGRVPTIESGKKE
jgi:glycosyltransferase involved in cell wall biosynthesis